MQVAVLPGVDSRLDLAEHLVGVDHRLAREVAAALGADLVFELDAVCPCPLEHAHRVAHVERIAEAGVGVDQQRQVHRVADARRVLGDLVQAHEGLVRPAEVTCW